MDDVMGENEAENNEAERINMIETMQGESLPSDMATEPMVNDTEEATMVEDPSPLSIEDEMDTRYGKLTEHYQLRPRRPRDFHRLHMQHTSDLHHLMMTQYSIKKGLKLYGKQGETAVTDELLHLHVRKVLEPKLPSEMTNTEIKDVL